MTLITILIVLSISEYLLSVFFVKWYFRFGIPVFLYRSKLFNPENGIPDASHIQNSIINSNHADIEIKKTGDATFGFRESFTFNNSKVSYTPVIRGFMYINREKDQVEVVGLLNLYSLLWFILMSYYIYLGTPIIKFIGCIGLIVGVGIFITQYGRYKHVARIAGENNQIESSAA